MDVRRKLDEYSRQAGVQRSNRTNGSFLLDDHSDAAVAEQVDAKSNPWFVLARMQALEMATISDSDLPSRILLVLEGGTVAVRSYADASKFDFRPCLNTRVHGRSLLQLINRSRAVANEQQ